MGILGLEITSDFSSFIYVLSDLLMSGIILQILSIVIFLLIVYIYLYLRSGNHILKWYGAQKIQKSDMPLLFSILEDLSVKAGIGTPEIYTFDSDIPSMFSVGNQAKSSIAISTTMLRMLDELKLEVLIAHECGHIKSGHICLNTITAFLAGLIMLLPNFVMRCSMLLGFGQLEDPVPRFFRYITTALVVPFAAIIVHLSNPAKKELEADKIAAEITRNPQLLAETLEFLEDYISFQPVVSKYNPGHFHLFVTHTQQMRGYLSIFISFFDTHPDTENRIKSILENSSYSTYSYSHRNIVPGYYDVKNWRSALVVSFFSYMIPLFPIEFMVFFSRKGDIAFPAVIAVLYIVAVLLLLGITAYFTKRKINDNIFTKNSEKISLS